MDKIKSINADNACDYDQTTLYKSGEFNYQYKTDLSGKIKRVEKQELPKSIVETFLDSKYETCKTLEDIVLYRVFGKYIGKDTGKEYGAGLAGAYATTEFAESVIQKLYHKYWYSCAATSR